MTSKNFYETLELVAQERNLALEDVQEKVRVALAKACALEGFTGEIEVEFSHEKKTIRAWNVNTVVEEIDRGSERANPFGRCQRNQTKG